MRKLFTILGVFVQLCVGHSQTNTNPYLSGSVKDEKGEYIEIGNVVLSTTDSVFINGAVFMDGKFSIQIPEQEEFLLSVSSIGYKPSVKRLNREQAKTSQTFTLESLMLNEVVVSAVKPTFKNEGDQFTIFVEGNMLSQVGNALDVLKKTPGVLVKGGENVSVFGKGVPLIYIDGQIASAEILKSIPSSEISKIEIIKDPGAKYDASGRAVINVITKSFGLEGFQMDLINIMTKATYWRNYSELKVNYRKNEWNLMARLGHYTGQHWSQDEYERNFNDSNNTISMKNKIINNDRIKNRYYYAASVSKKLDSTNTIGLAYKGYSHFENNMSDNTNTILLNNLPTYITTSTNGNTNLSSDMLNLNYKKQLRSRENSWITSAQYSRFRSDNKDLIDERAEGGVVSSDYKRNYANVGINIITGQSDILLLQDTTGKIETGIKHSYIFNSSNINFDQLNNSGEWIADAGRSNGFDYNEQITAAYFQYKKRFSKKIEAQAGLRSEFTQSKGYSQNKTEAVVDTNYINIFPTLKFTWHLIPDLDLKLNYSYRINRPSYEDLNPFINYIDSVSSERGNPNLKPQFTHGFSSHIIYMEYASIDFEYARTINHMAYYVDKATDGTNNFILQTKNYDLSETYSFGIVIPYENSWWTTGNGFGYVSTTFNYKFYDQLISFNRPTWYLYFYDEFRIPKLFNIELTFQYYSSAVEGMFDAQEFYQLDFSISRKFLDDKLSVRFSGNDILKSYVEKGNSFIPEYNIYYRSLYDTRQFTFGLTYTFGKLKKIESPEKVIGNEELQRIKSKN